ncbi:hypothetical protein RvY_18900-3 [Ramazzottius varieornatus]|uniref:Uncharacterized protein n=1 Tax=Ramazzottius varieornatus TaxID=947166 RepID=A0A1D1W7J0_RAMVA|nr:hypothetical protein RvY_18900-3 [Ramazzottius varieornatus]
MELAAFCTAEWKGGLPTPNCSQQSATVCCGSRPKQTVSSDLDGGRVRPGSAVRLPKRERGPQTIRSLLKRGCCGTHRPRSLCLTQLQ